MFLQYSQLMSLQRTPSRCIDNVKNWFYNNNGAIVAQETKFIEQRDLIPIYQRTKSNLRLLVDPWIARLSKGPLRMLQRAELGEAGSIDEVNTYCTDDHMVDKCFDMLSVVVGLTLIITPLWILQALNDMQTRLAIITGFVVVFFTIFSFATTGRPYEILAATAA